MTENQWNSVESEIDRFAGLYKSGNTIGWHRNEVNADLKRNIEHFPKILQGCRPPLVCLPLCGQSLDIPYLLSLGYRVFGIEAVPLAIENLIKGHDLQMTFDAAEGKYSTSDGNLVIFIGDILKCPIENYGPFDAVWDRGSLSVFPETLRQEYVQVIRRGLKSDFSYLLSVYDYDKSKSITPPRAVSLEDVNSLFGSWSVVKALSTSPVTANFLEKFVHLQGSGCSQVIYLFTPK